MILIRSPDDLKRAHLPANLNTVATSILNGILKAYRNYTPDDDGHIVVITPTDSDDHISERLGRKWKESMFEGVTLDHQVWHAVILRNNQFAISILADDTRLEPAIRVRFRNELGEGSTHGS